VLETPALRWIGSRSYSIYLWHWPVFMLTRPGFDVDLTTAWVRAGQLMLTFFLAELSYRWIEMPVRQHGFRAGLHLFPTGFRQWSVPQKMGVGAGVFSVSLLLLWQGTVHQVTPRAPREVVPVPQSALAPASIRAAATSAAPLKPQPKIDPIFPSQVTATPLVDSPRVTLIGDSIMQGAAPMIEDMLGQGIYIDAARKRKMEDVPALVKALSREAHLSRVVVIHLGSNRPFEAPVFDSVMEALLAHDVERVIFVNVHRPIGWEYYINQKFAEGVARWPQAELIDWDGMAHGEQSWFIRDQTHLSYAGSEAYVEAIQTKLNTEP
jgi:hypothetical protein